MREHAKALALALRALGSRDRTEAEIRSLLAGRDVTPAVTDAVIEALNRDGLVDDAGYARRFADDRRLLDEWGSERIARDLARRGVGADAIDAALSGVGRADELGAAVALLDRRYPLPFTSDRDRDKAWRMLVRRGYEAELAYEAVRVHERGMPDAA